ncbi:uncharacterized protein LOC128323015 [Hemicordylus capensis]|uniref:uncharacterized protein LOC128323015 n=1 Tax=Hemicordylus capensis TaxID=884348 RepID=UPI002303ABD8|nr:uncharacterized protein LOC128323015 [Hemicordylus capensis]
MRRSSDCPKESPFPKAGDLAPSSSWEHSPQVLTACEREETHNDPPSSEVEGVDSETSNISCLLELAWSLQSRRPAEEGAVSSASQSHKEMVPPKQPRTASSTESPRGRSKAPILYHLLTRPHPTSDSGHQSGQALLPGAHASAADGEELVLSDDEILSSDEGTLSSSWEEKEALSLACTQDPIPVPFMQPGASSHSVLSAEGCCGSDEAPILHHLLTRPHPTSDSGHQSGQALLPGAHASAADGEELVLSNDETLSSDEGTLSSSWEEKEAFSLACAQDPIPVPFMQPGASSHSVLSAEGCRGSDEAPILHHLLTRPHPTSDLGQQSGQALLLGAYASSPESPRGSDEAPILHHLLTRPHPTSDLGQQSGQALLLGAYASSPESPRGRNKAPILHHLLTRPHPTSDLGQQSGQALLLGAYASSPESPRGRNKAPILHHLLTRSQHASVLGQQSGQALLPNMHASAPEQVEPSHGLQTKRRGSGSHPAALGGAQSQPRVEKPVEKMEH